MTRGWEANYSDSKVILKEMALSRCLRLHQPYELTEGAAAFWLYPRHKWDGPQLQGHTAESGNSETVKTKK